MRKSKEKKNNANKNYIYTKEIILFNIYN